VRHTSISIKAGLAFSLLVATACSGMPLHAPGPSSAQSMLQTRDRAPLLYVANFVSNVVNVYKAYQHDPPVIDTLSNGVVAPYSLWVDAAGTLYVSNDFGKNNPYADTVTEFARGSHTPTKVLKGLSFPGPVAVDSMGSVYVQDSHLYVYEHGSTLPTRAITGLGDGANALTVDDHQNVYSLIFTFVGPQELCYSYVVKIPRGASGGKRNGVAVSGCGYGIALDAQENLYLAYYGNDNISRIAVFKPGSHRPFRTITKGLAAPIQIAFGPDGSLFVPNDNNATVTVYAPGGSTPTNIINRGVTNPFSVAISPPAPY
jgi:hypothetical protein